MRRNYMQLAQMIGSCRPYLLAKPGPWVAWEQSRQCCFQGSRIDFVNFRSRNVARAVSRAISLAICTGHTSLHKTPERKTAVKMTSLNDYDWIGFDLDHTLIQYKLDYLYPVSLENGGV